MKKRVPGVFLVSLAFWVSCSCSGIEGVLDTPSDAGQQDGSANDSDASQVEDGFDNDEQNPGDDPPVDNCPEYPAKTEPGFCGCGTPEGTCCERIETGYVQRLGAQYSFYPLPYSEDLDLASLSPSDTKTVTIIKDQTIEPASAGDSFVILEGHIQIGQPYPGENPPRANYDEMDPITSTPWSDWGGTNATAFPGGGTAVVRGSIEIATSGLVEFRPGYAKSEHNIIEIDSDRINEGRPMT